MIIDNETENGILKEPQMSKNTRRESMLEYIRNAKQVTCEELSNHFNVTEETIRKDLTSLSESGLIIRTFGGATVREIGGEISMDQRKIQNFSQKQKIAREANKLIKNGDLIVMDAGSSIVVLAQTLTNVQDVVVITNSLETTNVLARNEGVTVFCTGGRLRAKSMSFQGSHAENAIKSYNVNKAFITCAALDARRGIMDTNEGEVRIKNCMIKEAEEVYVLADSTKIGNIAYVTTCDIGRITAVITDDGITEAELEEFNRAGANIIVAK